MPRVNRFAVAVVLLLLLLLLLLVFDPCKKMLIAMMIT
jgi:hypothetical protein